MLNKFMESINNKTRYEFSKSGFEKMKSDCKRYKDVGRLYGIMSGNLVGLFLVFIIV